MIAFLRGVIVEKGAERVVVDVGGVGYLVQVSLHTLTQLPPTGTEAQILIHAHQTQDAPLALFGFATPDERELFELLISVHQVGPKLAQQILSGMEPGDLVTTIAAGNTARLRQVKGVGPKTADRIVLELRGKVEARAHAAHAAGQPGGAPLAAPENDIVSALVGLGYKQADAEKAVGAASVRAPGIPADRLLREALRQIQAR